MTWTLAHAVGLLLCTVVAWLTGEVRVVAAFGAASLGVLVLLRASEWTPGGRFGTANGTTALRVFLVVVLSARAPLGPPEALLIVAILALDGLDGLLARRSGTASAFGAEFDMETDALLVLVGGLALARDGTLGPFIVLPGVYRYAYAVAFSLVPGARGDAPRSRFGRYGFLVIVLALAASAWPLQPVHRSLAILATVFLTVSFGHSAWWSFFRREPARKSATALAD